MKVFELINLLKDFPQSAEVYCEEEMELYSPNKVELKDENSVVIFQILEDI